MNAFFKPHVEMLVKEGNQVDIACNAKDLELDPVYKELGCKEYQVDFSRSPLSPDNLKACGQLIRVIENGHYDIVHCHTPNASVITRLVCRKYRKKTGLKVFYTAHGFHFYKGAPKFNWVVFYPIEKFCSRFTDKLITINKEDYELAKTKFKAKEVHYVPGVGIDLSKFQNVQVDRTVKRKELGISKEAIVLLNVGELISRKNQEVLIRAVAAIEKLSLIIVGSGELMEYYIDLIKQLEVFDRIKLIGYRKDIPELCNVVDVFAFSSFHEGLPVSVMEAMAAKLPVVCSNVRGNIDLIDENGGELFDPHNVEECKKTILSVFLKDLKKMGKYNSEKIREYEISEVVKKMKEVYELV